MSSQFQNDSNYHCTKRKEKAKISKNVMKGLYKAQQLVQIWHCNTSGMQLSSLMAVAHICKIVWYVIRSDIKFPQTAIGKTERILLWIASSDVYCPAEHYYSLVTLKDHQMMYVLLDLHYRDHIVQFKCIFFHDTVSELFICNYCADV